MWGMTPREVVVNSAGVLSSIRVVVVCAPAAAGSGLVEAEGVERSRTSRPRRGPNFALCVDASEGVGEEGESANVSALVDIVANRRGFDTDDKRVLRIGVTLVLGRASERLAGWEDETREARGEANDQGEQGR